MTFPTEPTTEDPGPDADGDSVPDMLDDYPNDPLFDTFQIVNIECEDNRGTWVKDIDRVRPNWKQVWAKPLRGNAFCEYYGENLAPITSLEQNIWDAERRPDELTLSIPYSQCAESGTGWMKNEWPASPEQVREAETALKLCPNHPQAAAIRSRISEQREFRDALNDGRAFSDGNHRVNSKIQPGTYFSTNVTNCYWERLDSAGNIIDNAFVSDGLRVETYISSSDFSFHTDGCGTWQKVE